MSAAYETLRTTALAEIEHDRLDPERQRDAVTAVVRRAVESYQRRAHLGDEPVLRDPEDMVGRLVRSITAYGPLTGLLERRDVEEVFLEGDRVSYIDGTGRLQALREPTSAEENRMVVDRLLAPTDRRLDTASPLVQARVLDGSARLTAAIPPVADRLSATLRRHTLRRDSLSALVERDALSPAAAELLAVAMASSATVVVSGPPGAGKTSLLSALLAAVPGNRCIRICEEIRELNVPLTHGACYEARPAGLDGTGEISLRDLVKFTLAMRPDVIVVGEVRGAEAFELTRAINAGCGFASTVHANSARDALEALVNAAIMAGENVGEPIVRKVFSSAVDLLVHCDLDEGGPGDSVRRQVREIHAVAPALHESFTTEPLLVRERLGEPMRWTGAIPPAAGRLERALPPGRDLRSVLSGTAVAAPVGGARR